MAYLLMVLSELGIAVPQLPLLILGRDMQDVVLSSPGLTVLLRSFPRSFFIFCSLPLISKMILSFSILEGN